MFKKTMNVLKFVEVIQCTTIASKIRLSSKNNNKFVTLVLTTLTPKVQSCCTDNVQAKAHEQLGSVLMKGRINDHIKSITSSLGNDIAASKSLTPLD